MPERQSAQMYLVAFLGLSLYGSPALVEDRGGDSVMKNSVRDTLMTNHFLFTDMQGHTPLIVWSDSRLIRGLVLACPPEGISASDTLICFITGDNFVSALVLCNHMKRKCHVDMGILWQFSSQSWTCVSSSNALISGSLKGSQQK